jgi:hypothetical protein
VRILDEGLHDGLPWYAMELLEGKSLRLSCAALSAEPVREARAEALTGQARRLYAQALAIHRATGNRQFQARMLWDLSQLERLCGQAGAEDETPADPELLVQQAQALARPLGNPICLGLSLYRRGHLELSRGRSPEPVLAELRPLAESLHLEPKSELGQALGRLERAQQAFEAGEHGRLFRGEVVEDIPEGLRRWLAENGLLAAERRV